MTVDTGRGVVQKAFSTIYCLQDIAKVRKNKYMGSHFVKGLGHDNTYTV